MLATKNPARKTWAAFAVLAIALAACSPTGPGALVAGRKLLEADRTAEAIAQFQVATQLMPTNAAAWNYLGVAFHRAGLWTNAAAAYARALRFDRDLLEVRFNLGCLWLDQQQPEPARIELLAYTLRRSDDPEGWTRLATAQLGTGDLAGAEKSFREALRLDARQVEALNGIGLVLAQRNRGREAAEAFSAALQIQPRHPAALLNLATVQHQQLRNPAEALKRYREYLALQPRGADWDAVGAVVRSLEQSEAPGLARVAATNVALASRSFAANAAPRPGVAVPPAARPPVAGPSAAKLDSPGNKPVIAVATPTAASASPQSATNPAVVDDIAGVSGEPAVKVLREETPVVRRNETPPAPAKPVEPAKAPASKGFLAKLNPFKRESDAGKETSRGRTEENSSATKSETGIETYPTINAGKIQPGDRRAAEAALAQGQQAQRARRLAEALQFYQRAIHLDEGYFEAHYCLGLGAFEMRNFRMAAAAWENALVLRPDSADARYNHALALKADGRFSVAAEELEKLLALHPDEARGHLTLGIIYADHLKDTPRARLHYGRVLQLDPRNPQAGAIRYWLVANPR